MPELEWSPALELGLPEIDSQHKRLVVIANKLLAAIRWGKGREAVAEIIKELREYTVLHFRQEEAFMAEKGFPGRLEHARVHDNLVKKVKDYQRMLYEKRDVSPEVLRELLSSWLLDHILQEDMRLKRFLEGAEQGEP